MHAALTTVRPAYHRLVAGVVDKVVEYRISPDVLVAAGVGGARGADTALRFGWWPAAALAITAAVLVGGRHARGAVEMRRPASTLRTHSLPGRLRSSRRSPLVARRPVALRPPRRDDPRRPSRSVRRRSTPVLAAA